MGGQKGGMRNELGRWPELCKKTLQAMVADMQGAIQDQFFRKFSLAQLQLLSPRELEASGRLIEPLYAKAGGTHYESISWERAYDIIAQKLMSISPQESFYYFSGRSSNEAGMALSLLARQYGSNHINNCSYYCHQASGVGLSDSIGQGTATIAVEDIESTELFFLIGANPASNHPRLMTHLMHLKERGGKVVVVNPVVETGLVKFRVPSHPKSLLFGTKIADEYVQLNTGSDMAFLLGVAKVVIEQGASDQDFIAAQTEGAENYLQLANATSWEEIGNATGLEKTQIERVGHMYSKAKSAVFSWTMGITHHAHGVENVQSIVNLALLRGMVGKPGAGLLPIRGHSNVQGMGSIGVVPVMKPGMVQRYKAHGVHLPEHEGMDTLECMEAAQKGHAKVGFALGGNLFGSNPDANFAKQALSELELMIYFNTTLNTGHMQGRGKETLVLPVMARDEEPYQSTQESMFNYVRLSDGGEPRLIGPKSEVEIIAEIGRRVVPQGTPVDWQLMADANYIRSWIGKLVPGFESLATIGASKDEFHIPGRVLHGGRFAIKKAKFHAHALPQIFFDRTKYINLMSVRSEGQFNTVVYEDYDLYRGQDRRDVILLNQKDMERLGIGHNDLLCVKSSTGELSRIHARAYDIKEGHGLMYYPECNVLFSRKVDPKSKTPEFKRCMIEISKMPQAALEGAGQSLAPFGQEPRGENRGSKLGSMLRKRFRPKLNVC